MNFIIIKDCLDNKLTEKKEKMTGLICIYYQLVKKL